MVSLCGGRPAKHERALTAPLTRITVKLATLKAIFKSHHQYSQLKSPINT